MKNKTLKSLLIISLTSIIACSQKNTPFNTEKAEVSNQKKQSKKTKPHEYSNWYCPDNLNGFPTVNIADWKKVPVINGRMPTKEETESSSSLIFVDIEKYPKAKPLDISLPKLASFYNGNSKRNDLVIIIQAVNIDNDSIVGFRYLNGGNGSAKLKDISFLSEKEINMIPKSKFVTYSINIKASKDSIWNVLTQPKNANTLQPIFDKDNKLKTDWRKTSNLNYYYTNNEILSSSYESRLYGNFYIQNDYKNKQYSEKFILLENRDNRNTELKIVCGPFGDDYEAQKSILTNWAKKVKELSEKNITPYFNNY